MHMVELIEVLFSFSQLRCGSGAHWIHQLAHRQGRHGADVVCSRSSSEGLQSGDIPKSSIIATHPRCFFSHSESPAPNSFLPPGLIFDSGDTDLAFLAFACQAHE